MKARGCAALHVSSGGVSPRQKIALGPGYQVPMAAEIKAAVGLPTIAVGLITEAEQAEAIVAGGQADAVALARAMLYDPRWPWHAAATLGRAGGRAAAVLALPAARVQGPVPGRAVRSALTRLRPRRKRSRCPNGSSRTRRGPGAGISPRALPTWACR